MSHDHHQSAQIRSEPVPPCSYTTQATPCHGHLALFAGCAVLLLSRQPRRPRRAVGYCRALCGPGLPLVDVWTYTPKNSLNTSKIQRRTYDYVLILKPDVTVRRELLPWRNSPVTAQHSSIFAGLVVGLESCTRSDFASV